MDSPAGRAAGFPPGQGVPIPARKGLSQERGIAEGRRGLLLFSNKDVTFSSPLRHFQPMCFYIVRHAHACRDPPFVIPLFGPKPALRKGVALLNPRHGASSNALVHPGPRKGRGGVCGMASFPAKKATASLVLTIPVQGLDFEQKQLNIVFKTSRDRLLI